MKIDDITDIEVLRKLAKACRVYLKKDIASNDGNNYLFKKNEWYLITQDYYGFTLYSDDGSNCFVYIPYKVSDEYIEELDDSCYVKFN